MPKLNILPKDLRSLIDDPSLSENTLFLYFTDNRDPSASEPVVTAIGIPDGWSFFWWNQTTNDWFINRANVQDAMEWGKIIVDKNLLESLKLSGWNVNTPRSYSQEATPAFDTVYSPSQYNDTLVVVSVDLTSSSNSSAIVHAEIINGTTSLIVAQVGLTGFGNIKESFSFIVPAGSSYKLVSDSGDSNAIINLSELLL